MERDLSSEAQRIRAYGTGLSERQAEHEKNKAAEQLCRAEEYFMFIRSIFFKSGFFSQSIERFEYVPSCLANALVASCFTEGPVS